MPLVSLTRPQLLITGSLAIIFLLRFVSTASMGLMPQDAYYSVLYGQHLSLSYYDHPPLIGYLLRLSAAIFGKTVFAIKIADTMVTLLTIGAFYTLSAHFLSPQKAIRALVLLMSTFMVTILSLISTPDVPLMLFWTLSLTALYRAIFLQRNGYWWLSGLLMGLSFDSKYTGVLLPLGLIAFLIFSRGYRKLFSQPGPWIALAVFVLMVSPVIFWNAQHDFASFRFQSEERAGSIRGFTINPQYLLGVIGHQSAILTPVLFFAIVFFVARGIKKKLSTQRPVSPEMTFLLCFFLPAFAGLVFVSLFYWVKLNWLMPAYITGIILVARRLSEKWVRIQVLFSLLIHLGLAVEIFFYPIPIRSDDTWFGWHRLARHVDEIHRQSPTAFVFSADENKTASVLNFYSDSMVYGQNIIGENALQFDYIGTDLNALKGRDAFFINSVPNFKSELKENEFPTGMKDYFDSIIELNPILIKKNQKTMRKFLVFYCTNYHPKPQIAFTRGSH